MKMKILIFSTLLTMFLPVLQDSPVYAADVPGVTRKYNEFLPSRLSPDDPPVAVYWASPDGRERLMRSEYNNDFFELSSNFQPQLNTLYCGIASSVIVLNSLRLPKGTAPSQTVFEVITPKEMGGETLTYPSYSQLTLLGIKTDKIKQRDVIELKSKNTKGEYDPGLNLEQLKGVLETYGVNVTIHHVKTFKDEHVDIFRSTVKKVLRDKDHYIMVNIDGQVYGAATEGHISPLAAYDEISDSVLVLDVAGYLNPWHWVPLKDLYAAMNTKDGDEYRGYLVVSDKP